MINAYQYLRNCVSPISAAGSSSGDETSAPFGIFSRSSCCAISYGTTQALVENAEMIAGIKRIE